MKNQPISQSEFIKTKVEKGEKLTIEDLRQILPGTRIISVKTRPGWGIEVVTFQWDEIIFEFTYKEIDNKKIFSSLKVDAVEKRNIDYYRKNEGMEVITKITPSELVDYLAGPKFLSAGVNSSWDGRQGWRMYHFAERRDIIKEVVSERMAHVVDKVNQAKSEEENHWKYGINNRCHDRVKVEVVNQVIESIKVKKPFWLRYDPNAYSDCGCFWIDDGCTMGVFHPDTPSEIIRATKIISNDTEMVLYLLAVLSGQVSLSGQKIGLSPGNTCPQCGSFLSSGSTRTSIYESCATCGYSHSERMYD